jgi:hypothetical protein
VWTGDTRDTRPTADAASLRLDICRLDQIAPFPDLAGDEFLEIFG